MECGRDIFDFLTLHPFPDKPCILLTNDCKTSRSGFTISQNIKKNGFMIKSSIENVKLWSLTPKDFP